MTTINKIYLKVLAPLLRRENLICSSIWMIQPAECVLNVNRCFSPEVRQDLANKHLLSKTTTDHQLNWGAPEQMAVGTSY